MNFFVLVRIVSYFQLRVILNVLAYFNFFEEVVHFDEVKLDCHPFPNIITNKYNQIPEISDDEFISRVCPAITSSV
jgi:hypothetical protein